MSSTVNRDGTAAEAIKSLKVAYGVDTDKELAAALGVAATAVAQWRKRNQVPEKYALMAVVDLPVPTPFLDAQGVAVANLFLAIYEHARGSFYQESAEETRMWWAQRFVALSWRMDQYLRGKTVPQRKAALDAVLRAALGTDDVLEFIDKITTVDLP